MIREEATFWAALSVSACGEAELLSAYEDTLHEREIEFSKTDTLGRWGAGFMRGRCCAKLALRALYDGIDIRKISIDKGVFGHPVVRGAGVANAQLSISHSGDWAAALAFDEAHPMAIDIEQYSESNQDVILGEISAGELDAIALTCLPSSMRPTMLWTIKESLSKVLRSGLMSPFEIYEITDVAQVDGVIVSTFRNFAQYKCLSFPIGEIGLSITLPKRTDIDLDVETWESISQ